MATSFVLQRQNGAQKVYAAALLSSILARLQAAQQSSCAGEDGVQIFNAQSKLLLVDVQWSVGRKLGEAFDVTADPTKPFGIAFQSGSSSLSLDAALSASGYAGQLPVAQLADVFMLSWDAGLAPPDIAGLILDAPSPQVPTVAFERDGQLKWTLGPDLSDNFRFQRGAGFQDVLTFGASSCSFQVPLEAPTPAAASNDAKVATTAFVQTAVANLVDSAPATLDTLNELAAALGDDPSFAATTATQIGLKANAADVYTKTQADALLAVKVDATDPRLSDPRTPLDASVTDVKIAGALSQSKIAGLTSSLLALAPLNGATFTNDVGVSASKPSGGNVTLSATNSAAGFASLYLNAQGQVGQLYAGGSEGLAIGTNTTHGLTFLVDRFQNSTPVLQIGTDRNATFSGSVSASSFSAGGQAVVLTNDARLTDSRPIAAGSVTNASVASNAGIDPSKIAGTAVVTTDFRLSNARPPVEGSVTNASVDIDAGIGQIKISGLVQDLADRPTRAELQTSTFTPSPNSVTNASVNDGALSQAKIANLTSDLAAKASLSGATFSNDVTVSASKPSGGNTALNVANSGAGGFTSLYLNAPSETAQLFVGAGGGLTIGTNTAQGIKLVVDRFVNSTPVVDISASTRDVTINGGAFLVLSQPCGFVRFTGTHTVDTGGPHKASPDSALYNVGTIWSTSQKRFNIPKDALYQVSASVTLANRSNSTRVLVSVRRNGQAIVYNEGFWSAQVSFTNLLLPGDYLEMFVQHSGASSTTILTTQECHFACALLH